MASSSLRDWEENTIIFLDDPIKTGRSSDLNISDSRITQAGWVVPFGAITAKIRIYVYYQSSKH